MIALRLVAIALAICPLTGQAQYAEDETCARLAELESIAAKHLSEFTELSDEWADEFVGLLSNGEAKGEDLLPDDWASHSLHVQIASLRLFKTDDPTLQRLGFEVLEQEYETGSAFAAGKLGWAYQRGLGVNPDRDKALELYEYAAKSGMTYWQYLLAHAYEKGYLGPEVDPDKAAYWVAYKPKVHIALYECWVAAYYHDGTFPPNDDLQSQYQKTCDEIDLGEWWANFNSE